MEKLKDFIKKCLAKMIISSYKTVLQKNNIPDESIIADTPPRVAVQIHIFFIDLLEEICSYLSNVEVSYDLYISTDTDEKKHLIQSYFGSNKPEACKEVFVQVVENRGRDIYPFFAQMNPVYKNYAVIGHLHSKKSNTVSFGDAWRTHIFDSLLGDKKTANGILQLLLNDSKIGFVSPGPYWQMIIPYFKSLFILENRRNLEALCKKISIRKPKMGGNFMYPAGNMFFAKTSAIRQLFESEFSANDFPEERGQVDNTLQHTIEFVWGPVVGHNGFKYFEVYNPIS